MCELIFLYIFFFGQSIILSYSNLPHVVFSSHCSKLTVVNYTKQQLTKSVIFVIIDVGATFVYNLLICVSVHAERKVYPEQADYTSKDKIFACNYCVMTFSKLINLYKHLHAQVMFFQLYIIIILSLCLLIMVAIAVVAKHRLH